MDGAIDHVRLARCLYERDAHVLEDLHGEADQGELRQNELTRAAVHETLMLEGDFRTSSDDEADGSMTQLDSDSGIELDADAPVQAGPAAAGDEQAATPVELQALLLPPRIARAYLNQMTNTVAQRLASDPGAWKKTAPSSVR
ncbi:hypothetical protein J8273_5584 [Carpediemonas membranifera]|uniref:Uncharacterized protein n=1 Tax=Carpediemonas membranifera TaxID=201153 RepID=A0A8J6AUR5_9EUKA|nr:hypothetical protein J8273_5584 [Carpediemonas membranifera]|eukprot:KAG9392990.1 hypothetical protein J8273_5584 [Carpediemonas membranifera]